MKTDLNKSGATKSISDLKPCYLFISKSNSILEEKIDNLKKLLKDQINMDTDFKIFYGGEEIDEQEFMNYCNTPSFFSLRKVAVIKNFDKAPASLSKIIVKLLSEADPENLGIIFVMTSSKMPVSKRFEKSREPNKDTGRKTKEKTSLGLLETISAIGAAETLIAPTSNSLKKWLHEKSELDGLAFTQQAAARFMENVNFDFNLLKKEYEKIFIYMISEKEKTVNEITVNKLVNRVFEIKIFDLIDFIGKRDKSNSLAALKSVMQEKKPGRSFQNPAQQEKSVLGILTLLHRMFKAFLYIKSPAKKDLLKSYVERHMGHMPYMVGKISANYTRFAKNYNSGEIIRIFDILNKYDILLRTAQPSMTSSLVLKLISDIVDIKA